MEIQSGDFTRVSTGKNTPFCCMAIKYMLQNTLIKLSAAWKSIYAAKHYNKTFIRCRQRKKKKRII
jgi:hypothetical protein